MPIETQRSRRGSAYKRLVVAGLLAVLLLLTLVVSPRFGTVSHALGIGAAELPKTVVARGLLNPRGLAFGPDGSLYVAEAGSAGPDRAKAEPDAMRYHVGKTGRVSRLAPDGTLSVVAAGLPSALTSHDDDVGPTGITVMDGHLYVLTAAGGNSWGDSSYDNSVFEIGADGSATPVFDYQGYNIREPSLARRSDPRADVAGGMPFGMTSLGEHLYTTDGNLEFVLQLGLPDQTKRLLEYPTSNFVMTGITTGPDGALYVAELGPYPYFEGKARITRLTIDGEASQVWTGLTTSIGVAVADDGTLYALEYTAPLKQWENTGRVLRRAPDGEVAVLATGLNFPTALALGPDHALYVANNGHHAPTGTGEIVRLPLPDSGWLGTLWQRLRFGRSEEAARPALIWAASAGGRATCTS
jgi:hypothetical protein